MCSAAGCLDTFPRFCICQMSMGSPGEPMCECRHLMLCAACVKVVQTWLSTHCSDFMCERDLCFLYLYKKCIQVRMLSLCLLPYLFLELLGALKLDSGLRGYLFEPTWVCIHSFYSVSACVSICVTSQIYICLLVYVYIVNVYTKRRVSQCLAWSPFYKYRTSMIYHTSICCVFSQTQYNALQLQHSKIFQEHTLFLSLPTSDPLRTHNLNELQQLKHLIIQIIMWMRPFCCSPLKPPHYCNKRGGGIRCK